MAYCVLIGVSLIVVLVITFMNGRACEYRAIPTNRDYSLSLSLLYTVARVI